MERSSAGVTTAAANSATATPPTPRSRSPSSESPTRSRSRTGDSHSCAVLAGGTATCWGSNGFGQLGDGSSGSSSNPLAVVGLAGVTSISAGYNAHVRSGGRRRLLLGREHLRTARRRHDGHRHDAGRGARARRRGVDQRRVGPHVRNARRRNRSLLGIRRRRPARQRRVRQLLHRGRCRRDHRRRRRSRPVSTTRASSWPAVD